MDDWTHPWYLGIMACDHKLKVKNWAVILAVFFLSLTGIIFVFETQGSVQKLGEQAFFVFLGFVVMFFLSKFNFENYKKFSLIFFFISLTLLILVLIPGIGVRIYGARRWLNLNFFNFQPSELIKLCLIIFLSHWFINEEKNRTLAFFLLIGLIFALIMLQPDLGTALIISTVAFAMFFVSKTTEIKKLLLAVPFVMALLIFVILQAPYRAERFFTFLNPQRAPYGSSYHAAQALISVGSGGLTGVGFGKSRAKYAYLPESSTDSIFGIIAEETGFIGVSLIIAAYLTIFFKGWKIMRQTDNIFGRFLAFGVIIFLIFQFFLNLSSVISLLPLTGVPLPFISSGGSALLIQFAAVGILLNVGRKIK